MEFLLTTKRPHLLQATYRRRRMRVRIAQYLHSSDVNFRLTSLAPPDVAAWVPRLATPIDRFTAYPITDIMMRYIEELARTAGAHMYQTSHQEYALTLSIVTSRSCWK